ncbi:MAG: Alkaline phosphatase synthesis sensor protein PhoR [bacterium ADurb.Bin429]|nr:MAG: Alkaline phosphatase synthesis sensor protein PhoR [bacterium ADurb.Bin429]
MPDGTVDRFLLSLTDMTHHVRARQEMERLTRELQRQNAQMEAVMMSQAHGMVVYAPTGEIVTMNQAAESLLRYQPLERDMTVEERAVTFRILDEQGQPMAAADAPTARALRGETTYGTVMALQWPDRVLWVSASAAPIRLPDGQMLGAVASFTDVTALHALQEQMKTFIHTVSHDLRAPLTVIQGYTSMLLDGLTPDSDPLTRAGMTAIDRGVRRLDTMIEDLVAAARLEGGQMELTPRPLRLQAFLPELVNHNAAVLDASRIVLDLPADLPPALADDARLERILLNLLTNARKYSAPETPIRVSVRLDDDRLAIRVADQGQGIHPDDLPRLFEKFYRARGERRPDGIGLGLYITRLLTEAHGGTLSVESTLGQGSTFTVTLPVAVESPVV